MNFQFIYKVRFEGTSRLKVAQSTNPITPEEGALINEENWNLPEFVVASGMDDALNKIKNLGLKWHVPLELAVSQQGNIL